MAKNRLLPKNVCVVRGNQNVKCAGKQICKLESNSDYCIHAVAQLRSDCTHSGSTTTVRDLDTSFFNCSIREHKLLEIRIIVLIPGNNNSVVAFLLVAKGNTDRKARYCPNIPSGNCASSLFKKKKNMITRRTAGCFRKSG